MGVANYAAEQSLFGPLVLSHEEARDTREQYVQEHSQDSIDGEA